MLYLIGLGLGSPSDITVKGLEIVKKCAVVFLESYTSIMASSSTQELETFFGRPLLLADRTLVESESDSILERAGKEDVAFLVIGDPLGATTHTDLILRAKELGIPFQVVHNASILTAVGVTGLQLYSFGETVSIPFFTEEWKPDSFLHKILDNRKRGLHTLCLLDIKVKEPNLEAMMKGKTVFDPPRFMTCHQAATQLVELLEKGEGDLGLAVTDLCIGVARVGSETQKIVGCSLKEMVDQDLGGPLHSLIIPGKMHPMEEEFVKGFVL